MIAVPSEPNSSSHQTRRTQMKVGRSLFSFTIMSLTFLSLLVLSLPVSGFAQTPHTCKPNWSAHQSNTLGGVTSFPFAFAKSCTANSNATKWTIYVYNYNAQAIPICTYGPMNLPPDTFTATCSPLPKGPGYQVKVVINFERSTGSPMSHSESYFNP